MPLKKWFSSEILVRTPAVVDDSCLSSFRFGGVRKRGSQRFVSAIEGMYLKKRARHPGGGWLVMGDVED